MVSPSTLTLSLHYLTGLYVDAYDKAGHNRQEIRKSLLPDISQV